jgi:hypothetical protein
MSASSAYADGGGGAGAAFGVLCGRALEDNS